MSIFSERLKLLRLENKEKQSDVAELLGVSVQSYSAYEASREPNYKLLCELAAHYQVTTDYLLGRVNDRVPMTVVTIPVALGQEITSSEEEIEKTCKNFLDALGSVVILPREEKQPFFELINAIITMLKYSRCIGKTSDLMEQSVALDDYLSASMNLSIINSQLTMQAYKKFWEMNPKKRPKVHITWRADQKESDQNQLKLEKEQ